MTVKWKGKSSRQAAGQQCKGQSASSATLTANRRYTCKQGRQQLGDDGKRAGKQYTAHWQITNNAKGMMAREGIIVCRHSMQSRTTFKGVAVPDASRSCHAVTQHGKSSRLV